MSDNAPVAHDALTSVFPLRLVSDIVEVQKREHRIQTNEYQPRGVLPIIDQSTAPVAGSLADMTRAYSGPLPVVVFGDHTCIYKFVDFRFAVGADGTQLLTGLPGVDTRYLYYALHTSTVKQFGYQRHFKLLKQSKIPVPLDIAMQRRIASILGAYDDLIEVNRRRIAVTEEMARRLFEEWFVVRNLSGQAERTGDAAPWHRATVGEAVRFVRGRSYRSADLADSGGLPFVNLKCMLRDGGFRRDGLKRYVGEYKREHTLRTGDIVVAVTDMTQDRRIVGQAARIPRSDEPVAVMSMDLVKVVPTQSLLPLFCYYWLRFSGFAGVAAQHANGANVLHLSPSAMAGLPIEIPPIALQRAFCELAQPLTDATEVLVLSNERLAASRDLLLPRLISGNLPVAAAERELEAVA